MRHKDGKYGIEEGDELIQLFDQWKAELRKTNQIVEKKDGKKELKYVPVLSQEKLDKYRDNYLQAWMNAFVPMTPEEEADYKAAKAEKKPYSRKISIDRMEDILKHIYISWEEEAGKLYESLWGMLGLSNFNKPGLSEEERNWERQNQLKNAAFDLGRAISPTTQNRMIQNKKPRIIYMEEKDGVMTAKPVHFKTKAVITVFQKKEDSKISGIVKDEELQAAAEGTANNAGKRTVGLQKLISECSKEAADGINAQRYEFHVRLTEKQKRAEYFGVKKEAPKIIEEQLPDMDTKMQQLMNINDNVLFLKTLTGKDDPKSAFMELDKMTIVTFSEHKSKKQEGEKNLRDYLGVMPAQNIRDTDSWNYQIMTAADQMRTLIRNYDNNKFKIYGEIKSKVVSTDAPIKSGFLDDYVDVDVDVFDDKTKAVHKDKKNDKVKNINFKELTQKAESAGKKSSPKVKTKKKQNVMSAPSILKTGVHKTQENKGKTVSIEERNHPERSGKGKNAK